MIGKPRGTGRHLALVEECEAFLAGRMGELAQRVARRPTPSVWLNALAHAELEELRLLARHVVEEGHESDDRWAHAASSLASEVLRAGGDDGGLVRRIQLDLLVPVELKWGRDDSIDRSPAEIVRDVRDALGGYLRSGDRRHGCVGT